MSSIEYSVYKQEILNFLKTVTIKFDLFAEIMANRVINEIGTVITDNKDNPYYQNLCGQYSVLDTPIYVTSIETGEQVLFDTNLKSTHPKTAALYRIPSTEYNTLCSKYPNQVGLIKSIVYPVKTIDSVISAPNFSLLQYDSSLLHINERESLLFTLRKTLDYIHERWYIADYSYEEMYPVTFMGMIWAQLPSALLAQRVQNLRTSFVHPLHIWEYLFSKGVGDYRDILTDKQALFLYRNIDYILQNKGKKSTLEILASNLLQNLQVTLVGKTILQQTISGYDDCVLTPEFLSDDIVKKGSDEQIDESVTENMEKILTRISAEGYFPNLDSEIIHNTQELFGNTELNMLPTRLLELKKSILNTPYERLLGRFIFESFLYHLAKGHFTYTVAIVDPTFNIALKLNINQLFALFQYAHAKYLGEELSALPIEFSVYTPYKDTKPNINTLPTTVTLEQNTYLMQSVVDVQTTLNEIPFDSGPFTTIDEFFNTLSQQFTVLIKHIESIRTDGNLLYVKAFNELYEHLLVNQTIEYKFIDEVNYETWIDSVPQIKLLIDTYDTNGHNSEYYKNLRDYLMNLLIPTSNELFSKYTSYNLDNSTLYNGLKRLFIQLCSYRLTFLETERGVLTFIIIPPIDLGDSSSSVVDIGRVEIDTPFNPFKCISKNTIDLRDYASIKIVDTGMIDSGILPVPEGFDLIPRQTITTCVCSDLWPLDILDTEVANISTSTGVDFGFDTFTLLGQP